jgi:hypothetical protein
MALGAFISLLCGQLSAQESTINPFEGATNHNCGHRAHPPVGASSAGYDRLAFCDDFNSISTIDVNGTGAPGFNWYTRYPSRSPNGGYTLPSGYSVSHSVLTATSAGSWAQALTTRDPDTGNGQAWNFGYFEARIKFDPTLGPKAPWFPCFWSMPSRVEQFHNRDLYVELDFFEAYSQGPNGRGGNGPYPGEFLGTIHHWQSLPAQPATATPAQPATATPTQPATATPATPATATPAQPATATPEQPATGSRQNRAPMLNYSNPNNNQTVNVDWKQWHILGCLWVPGKVTWYLDGKALMSQEYSATAPPNPLPRPAHRMAAEATAAAPAPSYVGVYDVLDTQTMQILIGSAPGWPMYVDWVRVWEK